MSRLAAAHVGVLRQPFRWDLIESTSGRYRLRSYDDLVLAAAVHGIAVMPTIVGPPRRPAALTGLTRGLAMRYGPGGSLWHKRPAVRALPIRSWQIGDSPDTTPEYRSAAGAKRYARLLTAARRGVAGVDPQAEIISGGLQAGRGAVVARRYLRRLVRAGGIASVDSVAVNLPHGDLRQALGVVRDIRRALGKRRLGLRVTRVKYTMHRSRALARARIVRAMRALGVRGIVYETPPPG